MRTPPLAPGDDVTVHIVLNDFGPLGRAYVETDEAKADEATIIENILSGQYSHLIRVVAFNTAEGWGPVRAILCRRTYGPRAPALPP
jgi:hypothetical protein